VEDEEDLIRIIGNVIFNFVLIRRKKPKTMTGSIGPALMTSLPVSSLTFLLIQFFIGTIKTVQPKSYQGVYVAGDIILGK
jgi:hypothetical protein